MCFFDYCLHGCQIFKIYSLYIEINDCSFEIIIFICFLYRNYLQTWFSVLDVVIFVQNV